MSKDDKIKVAIPIIAIILIIAMSTSVCLVHNQKIKAEEALVAKSAIPSDQLDAFKKMMENLEIPYYCILHVTVTAESKDSEQINKDFKTISAEDAKKEVATMAIFDESNSDTYDITLFTIDWLYGKTTIALSGTLNGWEIIEWKSDNYDLMNELNSPKKFTVDQAENYKFTSKNYLPATAEEVENPLFQQSKSVSALYNN